MKEDIDGMLDLSETVGLVAEYRQCPKFVSGYKWQCPKCEHLNTEVEKTIQVQCHICKRVFLTDQS